MSAHSTAKYSLTATFKYRFLNLGSIAKFEIKPYYPSLQGYKFCTLKMNRLTPGTCNLKISHRISMDSFHHQHLGLSVMYPTEYMIAALSNYSVSDI